MPRSPPSLRAQQLWLYNETNPLSHIPFQPKPTSLCTLGPLSDHCSPDTAPNLCLAPPPGKHERLPSQIPEAAGKSLWGAGGRSLLEGWVPCWGGRAALGTLREELCAELSLCPLQAGSQQRQQDLNSLQDYMQRCTNKLYWLDQQAKDRTHYDWSDHNLDYPSRRRQYEVCAAAWPCSGGCWAKGSCPWGQGS